MSRPHNKKPGLLDALLSVTADPRGTTHLLLHSPGSPPHGVTVLCLFLGLYIVAPLLYQPPSGGLAAILESLAPGLIASILTFLLASFFMVMGLQVLGIRRSIGTTLAALAYCTSPLVSLMLVSIAASCITRGGPTIIAFFATGYASADDIVVQSFPYLLNITGLLSLTILIQSLRAITASSLSVSMAAALCTAPLILGAFVIALTLTDFIFPGSSPRTILLYQSILFGE